MLPNVIRAKYLQGCQVELEFNDGQRGIADLANDLEGPVFAPLQNPAYFAAFRIQFGTLTWPNGADFAPEFLYEKIKLPIHS